MSSTLGPDTGDDTRSDLIGAPTDEHGVDTLDDVAAEPIRSNADQFMRRLLRLSDEPRMSAADARSAFQKSLAFTACRCVLLYLVFPFVLPPLGVAVGVGPVIGITIGLIAMASIVYSIRRFWRADHSKRWHYTVFGTVIIGFLIYLTIKDLTELLS